MSNPLFNDYGPQNPYQKMQKDFENFKKNFSGNPKDRIQQMLNSGQITQQQYNAAVQKANMLKKLFGM